MNNLTVGMTYLSGHIPIAIIYAISVFWAKYKDELVYPYFFITASMVYFLVSAVAGFYIYKTYSDKLKDHYQANSNQKFIYK